MSNHSSTGATPITKVGAGGDGGGDGGQGGGQKGAAPKPAQPSADDLLTKKPLPGARMKLS